MKLTKEQAKELSIKKWEYIVGNNGNWKGLVKKYPELANLLAQCGYCEKYLRKDCENCPLLIQIDGINCSCYDGSHPHSKWAIKRTKLNAQKVLDLIRES
jgi:hypothetical protein